MARCGCGGAQCGCAVIAGDNIDVGGTGSAANPFVVSAVTDCAEVRACLHGAAGVAYDQASGTFSAALSGQAGNNLTVSGDGGLFVPAGAATVNVGCGLSGDGSGSAPVTVKTKTWPFACSLDAVGGGVYCDSTGTLRSDPPTKTAFFTDGANTTYSNITVPTALTTLNSNTLALTNPDPCRPATAIVNTEADVSFVLPPGASAGSAINGDEMWFVHNGSTTATVTSVHAQLAKTFQLTIPPGGTVNQLTTVGVTRGAASAMYNRTQWTIRAWLFT